MALMDCEKFWIEKISIKIQLAMSYKPNENDLMAYLYGELEGIRKGSYG